MTVHSSTACPAEYSGPVCSASEWFQIYSVPAMYSGVNRPRITFGMDGITVTGYIGGRPASVFISSSAIRGV